MKVNQVSEAEEYLRTRISELVENMTVDVLISRPNNVADFMIAWLEENGEKYNSFTEKKIARRPSGVETSGEDEEEEMEEIPMEVLKQRNINGRQSVAAEAFTTNKDGFVPRVVPKSPQEKLRITKLLKTLLLFSTLDKRNIEIIVDAMEVLNCEAGETVIKQGDKGKELFVVTSGRLDCFKETNSEETIHLKEYGPGDYFGELALLYNTPRAATIISLEDSQLLSLDRLTFNNIVKTSMMKNNAKFEEFLEKVPILSQLHSYERSRLTDCLLIKEYEAGEYVINEGEKGDSLFFVIEGTAVALKHNPSTGTEVEVFSYKENSYFGELALLRDEPRAASIKATSDLRCARIDRNSFKRMLGSLENILKRNAESYVKF